MKQVNFNAFKNIRASEEQLARALAIPETAEKTPAVLPWYRQTRMIAAAASIVLVTVLGFTLYFLIRNINPPVRPVVPVGSSDSTASPTDSTSAADGITATDATEDTTKHQSEKASEKPGDKPTDNASVSPTTPTGASATSPTENGSIVPPTQAPTSRATQAPVTPTQKPAEKPTTKPVQKPTVKPTDEPIAQQTDTLSPTEEPWDVTEEATEPPSPYESAPATQPTDGALTLRCTFSAYDPRYSGVMYCKIYSITSKQYMGDADLYAASHRAECTVSGKTVSVSYCPSEHGITLPNGKYSIAFYNEKGVNIYARYLTV